MLQAWEHFSHSAIAPVYAVGYGLWGCLMMLEIAYSAVAGKRLYNLRDSLTNAAMYGGYFAINLFWVPVVFLLYSFMHEHALLHIGIGAWHSGAGGLWWEWLLLFFLEDLCFYTFHRTSHKLGFFWAAHVTHHSSPYFNLSTAFRQTWTPFVAVIFWLPLPLLGFDPLMVMTLQLFSLFFQLGLHTQVVPRLGPLEYVFNTPMNHRLHHALNPHYVDRNFGGVLMIWDRLFGTYAQQTDDSPPRYGIHRPPSSGDPLTVAFHGWWEWLRKQG